MLSFFDVVQLHPVLMLIGFIILGGEGKNHNSIYCTIIKIKFDITFISIRLMWSFDNDDTHVCIEIGNAAIISYKSLPLEKPVKKLIHLILHAISLSLGIWGICAAFKNHNESGIPNLYSLHSWIGIGVISLYAFQVKSL